MELIIILDILINGKTKPIDKIPRYTLGSWSKLFASVFPNINKKIIIKTFTTIVIGNAEATKTLLFLLSSETSFEIAIGRPSCASAINNIKVGDKIIYIPIPSVPTSLVIMILITIPKIFVMKPPTISIRVDLTNLLFFIISPLKLFTFHI